MALAHANAELLELPALELADGIPAGRSEGGLRIAETGVTWRNDAASRVGIAAGARAFADLWRIRRNLRRNLYDAP